MVEEYKEHIVQKSNDRVNPRPRQSDPDILYRDNLIEMQVLQSTIKFPPSLARGIRRIAAERGIHEDDMIREMLFFANEKMNNTLDGKRLFEIDEESGGLVPVDFLPTEKDNVIHFPVEKRSNK